MVTYTFGSVSGPTGPTGPQSIVTGPTGPTWTTTSTLTVNNLTCAGITTSASFVGTSATLSGNVDIGGTMSIGGFTTLHLRGLLNFTATGGTTLTKNWSTGCLNNISRITTGKFQITFSSSPPSSNYFVTGNGIYRAAGSATADSMYCGVYSRSTSSFNIITNSGNSNCIEMSTDGDVTVAVFW